MPHLKFAAVPTWGTNASDLARLRAESNITILEPVDNIDDLLRHARVVLGEVVIRQLENGTLALMTARAVVAICPASADGLRRGLARGRSCLLVLPFPKKSWKQQFGAP